MTLKNSFLIFFSLTAFFVVSLPPRYLNPVIFTFSIKSFCFFGVREREWACVRRVTAEASKWDLHHEKNEGLFATKPRLAYKGKTRRSNSKCRPITCTLKSSNYSIHPHFLLCRCMEGWGWGLRVFAAFLLRRLSDRKALKLMWKMCCRIIAALSEFDVVIYLQSVLLCENPKSILKRKGIRHLIALFTRLITNFHPAESILIIYASFLCASKKRSWNLRFNCIIWHYTDLF